MYAPYSSSGGEKGASAGTTLFVAGIIMLGISSTLSGVNFIATIMAMRAPGNLDENAIIYLVCLRC